MAQAVHYKLAVTKGPEFAETIWIDEKTRLPVKRVYFGTDHGEKCKYTETYSDV